MTVARFIKMHHERTLRLGVKKTASDESDAGKT
jgi:hypothetical protein